MSETWVQIITFLAGVLVSVGTLYIRERIGRATVRQMDVSTIAGIQDIYKILISDLQQKMAALEIAQAVEKASHGTLVKALYLKIEGLEELITELRDEIKVLTKEKKEAEAQIDNG